MHQIKLADNVFYLGYNDRRTNLFENLWPLPYGVSYNSYLVIDEKIALVDTVERQFIDSFLDDIEKIAGGRKIDYLVVNHMEPDHSGAINAIKSRYPGITLVGNKKTLPLIENFYFKPENFLLADDNDVLNLGKTNLKFVTIPMVHWPETMATYDETNKILFSGDAFGSFGTLDGGVFDDEINLALFEEESMRYFTNIVGKYCPHTQRALNKLASFDVKIIASTHGPVWRSNPDWILSRYQKWSSYTYDQGVLIVYGSMYGNTKQMAEVIARQLAVRGIKNIRVYDASKTHPSHLISDLFKYKGFIVGSAAYNNELLPSVETFLTDVEHYAPKNHYLGIFGNFSWSGGGVKNLKGFAERINWELVSESVEEKGALKEENFGKCIELANAMADKLLAG
jgi:flavorubredoxin